MKKYQLSNASIYGVSEEFSLMQSIKVVYGRYLTEAEFLRGSPLL